MAVAIAETRTEDDLGERVRFPFHAEVGCHIVAARVAVVVLVVERGAVARQDILPVALADRIVVGMRITEVTPDRQLRIKLLAEVQADVAGCRDPVAGPSAPASTRSAHP